MKTIFSSNKLNKKRKKLETKDFTKEIKKK